MTTPRKDRTMSISQAITTRRRSHSSRPAPVRQPTPVNDNARPLPSPQPPALTVEHVRSVLAEIWRHEASDLNGVVRRFVLGQGFGLMAAAETTAAVERAKSVRPVIDAVFALFPCWSQQPFSSASELCEVHNSGDYRALETIKNTVYATIAGAYGDVQREDDDSASIFEEVQDSLDSIGEQSNSAAVLCAASAASWMLSMLRAKLGSEDPVIGHDDCLLSANTLGDTVGSYLVEHRGRVAFDAFIDALRAIPAAC